MVFYFYLVHSFFIFQFHVDLCYFICYFISIFSAVLFKRFAEKVILFEILYLILTNMSGTETSIHTSNLKYQPFVALKILVCSRHFLLASYLYFFVMIVYEWITSSLARVLARSHAHSLVFLLVHMLTH